MTDRRDALKRTFDRSAALYDAARPGYPDQLFADLRQLTNIASGGRILEIGAGTGKATVPLARQGFRLVALEPGPHLAAVLRSKLAGFSSVTVEERTLEDWLPAEPFDLVVAATSFTWLDPAVRAKKIATALRPGGYLAVFWNAHVQPVDEKDEFFSAVQMIYRAHTPDMVGTPSAPDTLPTEIDPDILESGLFTQVATRRYPWTEVYTADRYIRLLQTFSGHIALPDATRRALLRDIRRLIDDEFNGRVVKHHVTVLHLARRI